MVSLRWVNMERQAQVIHNFRLRQQISVPRPRSPSVMQDGSGTQTMLKLCKPTRKGSGLGGVPVPPNGPTSMRFDTPRSTNGLLNTAAQLLTVPPRLFQTRTWNVPDTVEPPNGALGTLTVTLFKNP